MLLELYINPIKVFEQIKTINNNDKVIEINNIMDMISTVDEISVYEKHDKKDIKWRAGRVKYFMNHPEKIDKIHLVDYDILKKKCLLDGNLRLIASVLLKLEFIPCEYDGGSDYFYKELSGKIKYAMDHKSKEYVI